MKTYYQLLSELLSELPAIAGIDLSPNADISCREIKRGVWEVRITQADARCRMLHLGGRWVAAAPDSGD